MFAEKLQVLSRAKHFKNLSPELRTIIEYRNAVAHGSKDSLKPLSLEKFLAAAEQITARLASENKAKIP